VTVIILFLIGVLGIFILLGGLVFAIINGVKHRYDSPKERSENEMPKSNDMIKTLYTYVVLFATLMMTIGGCVGIFMGIADYVAPHGYYQTYQEYKQQMLHNPTGTNQSMSEEQILHEYTLMKQEREDQERIGAIHTLLASLGWIVIPLPVFLYFQRQVRIGKSQGEIK
jgi:hypothetical protein